MYLFNQYYNKARSQGYEQCLAVLDNSAEQGVLAYSAVTTKPKLTRAGSPCTYVAECLSYNLL